MLHHKLVKKLKAALSDFPRLSMREREKQIMKIISGEAADDTRTQR